MVKHLLGRRRRRLQAVLDSVSKEEKETSKFWQETKPWLIELRHEQPIFPFTDEDTGDVLKPDSTKRLEE